MPKYIDATKLLITENDAYWEKYSADLGSAGEASDIIHIALPQILDAAPAEDVVPVVRCRDCKHRTKETRWTRAGFCGRRGAGDHFLAPPDGYCCYGEREQRSE